jgi:DNA-binding MarR family transcriptional regulator/GNAT superfamily N-acetyltransferase
MNTVTEVRRFNRFYTRQMGLLNEHLPASQLSLAEARVIYELATGCELTSADLCRRLEMDKAHVSRILGRFRARRYIRARSKPDNAKHVLIGLTRPGRRTFTKLDAVTRAQIQHMLRGISATQRRRLVAAFGDVHDVLGTQLGARLGARTAASPPRPRVRIRRVQPGDLGYIASRQAVLYHEEYGWDWTYEALVCEIFAKYVREFDRRRDDGWVAEANGRVIGSIFLVRSPERGTAKLRLLYVEPSGRGRGLGGKLVQRCIARAQQLGYRKLALWTNSVLVSARRIYEAAGFRMVHKERHTSFGKRLVSQTWELNLAARPKDRGRRANVGANAE